MMLDFRFLVDHLRNHAVITGLVEDPRELAWCYTDGGRKLHLAWDDSTVTLCGLLPAQLVLAEHPVPDQAVCEWCRAASYKENP